jgi:hypothetical protein
VSAERNASSPPQASKLDGPLHAIRWLPVLVAAAYVAVAGVFSRDVIAALGWDSDVAAPFVLVDRLRGDGSVYIPHYGSWTVLWWLLATRELPGHVQIWEATGYVFAVAAAALLGWATARVAGRWAGITAASAALIVGPFALRSQFTVIFHVLAPFTAAVLAAHLVLLTRRWSRVAGLGLAVAIGFVAGANAASDALVWVGAIVPFGVAAALLAATTRRRDVAVRASTTLVVAVGSAVATSELMRGLGFNVVGREFPLAGISEVSGNTVHFGRMVALLGGANYALPGGYPREPLRILVAALFLAAVAVPVVSAFLHVIWRSDPMTRSYAVYWGAAVVLVGLSFIVTNNATALGAGSANYLLTLPLAAGAGLGLLGAASRRTQIFASLAIAAIGAINIVGIMQGRTGTARSAIVTQKQALIRFLARQHVTHGYAGYWDAQNLTWQSDMRLFVAPIVRCDRARKPQLCGFNFSTISSWFEERPGGSFLIVDPTTPFINEPPSIVSEATTSERLGPLTAYVFSFDLARYIQPPER